MDSGFSVSEKLTMGLYMVMLSYAIGATVYPLFYSKEERCYISFESKIFRGIYLIVLTLSTVINFSGLFGSGFNNNLPFRIITTLMQYLMCGSLSTSMQHFKYSLSGQKTWLFQKRYIVNGVLFILGCVVLTVYAYAKTEIANAVTSIILSCYETIWVLVLVYVVGFVYLRSLSKDDFEGNVRSMIRIVFFVCSVMIAAMILFLVLGIVARIKLDQHSSMFVLATIGGHVISILYSVTQDFLDYILILDKVSRTSQEDLDESLPDDD